MEGAFPSSFFQFLVPEASGGLLRSTGIARLWATYTDAHVCRSGCSSHPTIQALRPSQSFSRNLPNEGGKGRRGRGVVRQGRSRQDLHHYKPLQLQACYYVWLFLFSPSETFWVWPSFVLIQKVWSFLAFLHAVRFTFKLSYSDNNILSVSHVGDCTLVWRKDSSLKMSVSMDYSRGHRFIMYILLMVTPASRRMPFTSQTPHFQAGFLIHPNSRQKALLRKAGSFSNYYRYSTNLTKDLILLLKILLFDSALEDFSWAILKNWLFRRPLTIFIWCPFLFFVILRRSVGVLGSPRDSEPKMAQGVVGGEGREGEHAPGFWNMLFRTYMCNNEVFPCLLKLIKVKNKS